jgi:hypothetical protein
MCGLFFARLRTKLEIMKAFFSAILLAGMASQASAQAPSFGIKAGVNIASLSTTSGSTSSKISGHGGFLAHIHLAPSFALQPEIVYSGQGMKQNLNGVEYDWNLNYINVPIMFQYMFSNGFRVEAGPQVGLLLSAKIKNAGGSTDIKDDLKGVDMGLGFGLNYLTYSGFGLGGRYNLGLSNINKNNGSPVKNRVGQVSLFYMFQSTHKASSR